MAAVFAAFFVTPGAESRSTASPCETPQQCILGTYDVTISARVDVTNTDTGALTESMTVDGTLRKLQVSGELTRSRRSSISIQKNSGGTGTLISKLVRHDMACDFTKTFRTKATVELDSLVQLGWQPTRAEQLRSGGGTGELEITGAANVLAGESPPRGGSLCPTYRDEELSVIMGSYGVGKCSDPAGARLTFDRSCLVIGALQAVFTLPVTKRQTLNRLAFPINRLWARQIVRCRRPPATDVPGFRGGHHGADCRHPARLNETELDTMAARGAWRFPLGVVVAAWRAAGEVGDMQAAGFVGMLGGLLVAAAGARVYHVVGREEAPGHSEVAQT